MQIALHKPDFVLSADDSSIVSADSEDHDAISYQRAVLDFLERRFPKTFKAAKND